MRRLAVRVVVVFVVLAAAMLASFAVWGEGFERWLAPDKTAAWFAGIRPTAWLAGIGLLLADLVLPIPATPVMAALGTVYGPWVGGAVATLGSALAGYTGYYAARLGQHRFLAWLARPEEVESFRSAYDRWGGLAVAAGRSFPVLPEVTTILAGLAGMHAARFSLALWLGSAANGFLYAALGSLDRPVLSFLVASAVPMALWIPLMRAWRRRDAPPPCPSAKNAP